MARNNGDFFDALAGLVLAGALSYGLRALFGPSSSPGYEISPGVHIMPSKPKHRPSAAEQQREEFRRAREEAVDAEFVETDAPRPPEPG